MATRNNKWEQKCGRGRWAELSFFFFVVFWLLGVFLFCFLVLFCFLLVLFRCYTTNTLANLLSGGRLHGCFVFSQIQAKPATVPCPIAITCSSVFQIHRRRVPKSIRGARWRGAVPVPTAHLLWHISSGIHAHTVVLSNHPPSLCLAQTRTPTAAPPWLPPWQVCPLCHRIPGQTGKNPVTFANQVYSY